MNNRSGILCALMGNFFVIQTLMFQQTRDLKSMDINLDIP